MSAARHPHDRVGVDCGAFDRFQFVESYLVSVLLGGELAASLSSPGG